MDTSGKDGTVKHVIGAMNPGGCRVVSFKAPTEEERRHDFLWRIRRALPAPGQVGVFNRSHYEDVMVVRVDGLAPEETWRPRYRRINAFEKSLSKQGVTVLKLFLHISKSEQKDRLLKRLEDPTKRWKFKDEDLDHRDRWDEFMDAYGEAIGRCSIDAAPWYVVPANAKWFRNWAIGRMLIETLEEMNPGYPDPVLDVKTITARLNGRARRPTAPEPGVPRELVPEVLPIPDLEPAIFVPEDARDLLVDTTERPEV
jgi:PPK2 family polyphosphate:nucleotide phosphotransferase